MKFRYIAAIVLLWSMTASGQWLKHQVNTTASLRGLSVVNEKVVWASGTGGTVIKTVDGGKTWNVMTVPEAEKLDFRDIEAFDATTAYVLSIGNGESSRIDKIYCVYTAPSEELIKQHADQSGFPANRISEVKSMIDPTRAG